VHLAGITEHPKGHRVAQQARNFSWFLQEQEYNFVCLIRENNSKHTESFKSIFASEGINIICIPFKTPNANTFAEWWVRKLGSECLNNILAANESHLRRVFAE